jgi:hypothetical protein
VWLQTAAHFDTHGRRQHGTSIMEFHGGIAVEYLFVTIFAVARIRRCIEVGESARAAPIVANA